MQPVKRTGAVMVLITIGTLLSNYVFAQTQSWSIKGNANIAAGTNYLGTKDPNDLVIRTAAIERGRVFGTDGKWRFGNETNNFVIDARARLSFNGSGGYFISTNRYVFQYGNNATYGLFFNSLPLQYEFRDSTSKTIFSLNANSGAGMFSGTLKIGDYTLPAKDGANGEVLKTDGDGKVSWSNTSNWALKGNKGTDASKNFIGTTDSVALVLKTYNIQRLHIGASGDFNFNIEGTGTSASNFWSNGFSAAA